MPKKTIQFSPHWREFYANGTSFFRYKYLKSEKASSRDIEAYYRFAEDLQSWGIYYATVAVTAQK